MRKILLFLPLIILWAAAAWSQAPGATSAQLIRPIGVVTKIQAGNFTLHTDAGPDLLIVLADSVSFLRVPPGSTNLNSATKISLSDVSLGDRILVRGRVSEDQKSVVAASVIVTAILTPLLTSWWYKRVLKERASMERVATEGEVKAYVR